MKSKIFSLFLLSLFVYLAASAQVPQGFNYQAVLRDYPSNNPIISQGVQIRFTIQTAAASVVYQETYSTSTDDFGAISLVVGKGTPVGSYDFTTIDWSEELYLKTEYEYPFSGTPDYDKTMGTMQLMSVPYAMVAEGFNQPVDKFTVMGNTASFEEPLFEVKNTAGNTVFAVYNEGVRIYVGDGAVKSPKGGFAIGGFGSVKDENSEKYLWVDDDSVRIYINDNAKSAKGGFAIGGYGSTKGLWFPRYLRVTSDSTRVMTTDAEQGFGVRSGSTGSYLRLTPENYFIGHSAGRSITTGKFNSFLGYEAGKLTQGGAENIFIGYQSGLNNISGQWNTFLGYKAGTNNTGSDNTFIGYLAGNAHQGQGGNVYIGSKAGQYATNGQQNVLIGESVGANITTGSYNVLLGFESGNNNSDGAYNVFLGYQAGYKNDDGKMNVFIGYNAGLENIGGEEPEGDYNIALGAMAGEKNQTGSHNVFLGQYSGRNNTTGSENVYIGSNAGSFNNKSQNTFVGTASGNMNQTGEKNVFMGYFSGGTGTSGSSNTFIGAWSGYQSTGSNNSFFGNASGLSNTGGNNSFFGYEAGASNTSGSNNTFFGYKSGTSNAQGNFNTFYGYESGFSNQSTDGNNGSGNTYIGYQAGRSNTAGINNIFIGQYAGYSESGSEKLIINNSFTDPPLIYGEFNNDLIKVNATFNIRDLIILDAIAATITSTSDFVVIPLKSNILLHAPAASTLNTTTPIANGTAVGQILILRGSNSTSSITINDEGNVDLQGTIALGPRDSLMLMWDGTIWIQIAATNN